MYDTSVLEKKVMKNEKKLFSIGEVARATGVTRRIILNYEDKGLISYDFKNGENGNRYYSMDTLTKVYTVRNLQKLGLSLNEIKGYLDGDIDLTMLIRRLEDMRDAINMNIEKLYERAKSRNDGIKEVCLEEQTVYRRTYIAKNVAEKTDLLRRTALEAMQLCGTYTGKRMYFIEHPLSEPEKTVCCAAVPPQSSGEHIVTLHKTPALSVYHRGAYEELPNVLAELISYAKENGIELSGICRYVFLEGPPQHKDKSLFITRVFALLKQRSVNGR